MVTVAPAASALDMFNGEKIYAEYCSHCHGVSGSNPLMPGVPDFSFGERLTKSDAQLIRSVEYGKGIMPAYRAMLKKQEIADVVAYIRTLF